METIAAEAASKSPVIVGVRFMSVGKVYHFDATAHPDIRQGDWVLVNTARGRQIGEVAVIGPPRHDEVEGSFKSIERIAGNRDLAVKHYWDQKSPEALVIAREKIKQLETPIKVIKADYSFDGSRLSFLYTAEENVKVDLEPLSGELQRAFKAKVELRLIGPRDAAKFIGGGGACGLDTRCCSMFITEFSPISIKMAKEQGISLNPTEITGMCGRLRCCLIYEYEQYVEARKKLPKRGKEVDTVYGRGKVVDVLPLRDSVVILIGEATHEIRREDIQPVAELEALEKKAAAPCGLNPGCACKHARKRKDKNASDADHGENAADSG